MESSVKFSSLVRRRTKALSVFQKALDKLMIASEKISEAITRSRIEISDLGCKVEAEKLDIRFLEAEGAKVGATVDKIKEVIGE